MRILILILIFQIIKNDEINKNDKLEIVNNKLRIEDEDKILDKNDFDEIKEIIHKNFPYLIIRLISGNDADRGKKITFFEASSFNHFTEECKKYKDMCDYGFSIDVYIREHLLIIEVGDESKKLVDDLYNQRMRNSIRDELKKKNWAQAIKKVLIFINYRLSGQEIIKFSKSNDYPQIFILTIMFPSFLIGIIILTIILYFGSTKYIFCGEVKLFFDGIIHNLEELNSAQDPDKKRIQLKKRQCLFCWQPSEGNEYFMHCGHSYHEQCLRQWNLIVYGCCPCSYEAYEDDKEDETACLSRPVYLNIEDIKILLGLCLDAFRKENIYDYFIENKELCDAVNLGDLMWINQKKFELYSSYRIFYKVYKAIKLIIVFVTFYPQFLKSKKVRLIERLMKMKNKGFFGG